MFMLRRSAVAAVSLLAITTTLLRLRSSTAFSVGHQIPSVYTIRDSLHAIRYTHTRSSSLRSRNMQLFMTTHPPNLDSTDPFAILGLEPSPLLDKKEIKRAYKRLALKYHPDMTTNKDSSPEEKKRASDVFARINWAYETISSKGGVKTTTSGTSTSTSTGGWTPPHRRQGAYASSTSTNGRGTASTDWRDYIPNYPDNENYDADGDSFGAILSDLFAGAAGAAGAVASGAGSGIFKDFVEFLENNVEGYSTSSTGGRDAELDFLLQTGTLDDIGEEMDETDLVVHQLNTKLKSVKDELIMLQAEVAVATRFTEKLQLQERIDELEARKKVVKGYIQRAQKRLLALQTRYKQLIVGGEKDRRAGGRSSYTSPSWDSELRRDTSSTSSQTEQTSSSSSRSEDSGDDTWNEGFGSFGRGRGSSRRRTKRRTTSTTAAGQTTSSDYSTEPSSSSRSTSSSSDTSRNTDVASSYSAGASSSAPSSPPTSQPYEPPHRRTSSYASQVAEDKRRLRELKVQDEFDQLKRDLGL